MIKYAGIFLAIYLYCQVSTAAEYIFSAPPTESREVSEQVYQPIAEYLSKVAGQAVVYKHPGNWLAYIRNMQQAKYDFLLGAAHFVSWRVEKIEHRPLIALAESLVYVVVTKIGRFQSLYDLKGKSICSSAIPDLDALTLVDQFGSAWTQPTIRAIHGFNEKITDLLAGKCDAAVLPLRVYKNIVKLDNPPKTIVIFQGQVFPHFRLSVSPRVNLDLGKRIQTALLSSDANLIFRELTKMYALDGTAASKRITANADVYRGYAYLLEKYWGF